MIASFKALREPNFLRYYSASTISSAGTYAADIALVFGILNVWGPSTLALTLLAKELAIVVLLLLGGVIADRFRRERVIACCAVAQACSQALIGVALLSARGTDATAALIVALAAVNGASIAFARPARSGLVPLIVSRARLQEANALLGMTTPIVGLVGLAVGASFTELVAPGWALIFDAGTFVVSAALFASLKVEAAKVERSAKESMWSSAGQGWVEVRSRRWLWVVISMFAVVQLSYFPAFYVLGSSLVKESYGGAAGWALIVALQLVGGVAGGLVSTRIPLRRPILVVCFSVMLMAAELMALAIGAPFVIVLAFSLLSGLGLTVSNAAWATTLHHLIPPEVLGRVSSFDWLGSLALAPLGYAIAGPLATVAQESGAIALAAVAILSASVGAILVPDTRRIRLEDDMGSLDTTDAVPATTEEPSGPLDPQNR